MPSLSQAWALPVALLAIANISATWWILVSGQVPDPYLASAQLNDWDNALTTQDEFFHVPQAQRYCNGDSTWDPKITTPPGLYLASLLFKTVASCEVSSLRALNVGAICLIYLVSYQILRTLRDVTTKQAKNENEIESTSKQATEVVDDNSLLDAHSALNISLFPPLFFFSALYYTDVMSTLAVLVHYYITLKRKSTTEDIRGSIAAVIVGVAALLFRQTNIFWVAVFPAALAVVDTLKEAGSHGNRAQEDFRTTLTKSWSLCQVYDCPVEYAGLQDYLLLLLSVVLVTIRKPLLISRAVVPYLGLVILFAAFVAWNGGVVLGDKSAHVATLHLPQMLYLWPYIIFFSMPLTVGLALTPIVRILPNRLLSLYESFVPKNRNIAWPGLISTTLFSLAALGAIHYNTIIHPYTQADNRHYVFYAFRILLRHPAIKYFAVPWYLFCAWLTIQTLANGVKDETPGTRAPHKKRPVDSTFPQQSCQVSFIIVWIATTALSVATAPLVEPRYFITPWVVWRLHIPYCTGPSRKASYDVRLVLETIWLLAIDIVIGYIFLYRGFSWPSEPGNIQRFLW